jgi:hypothetical protein
MRPEFVEEMQAILRAKDDVENEKQQHLTAVLDDEEDFTQQFQEVLKTRILPQFEIVAGILSRNYYPAEVRVVGIPGEKACYLTFSGEKATGNWSLKGGEISGPRMAFRAERAERNVAYFADYKDGKAPKPELRLKLSDITDSFIEKEIRRLFESFSPALNTLSVASA